MQAQMLEANAADALLRDVEEQADFGLAKAINRLHGVADNEEGPSIIRFPAPRQGRRQRNLAGTRVLELVDEQMHDPMV
jgi:hypothetical protein